MASGFPQTNDNFATNHADGVSEIVHASTVNDNADAINKIEGYLISAPNLQTASYTLVAADNGKIVSINNASANTLTVPANATVAFPVGTTITIRQAGAGQTNVVGAGGVTIQSRGGLTHLAGQFAYATLIKVATDTWDLTGDIA